MFIITPWNTDKFLKIVLAIQLAMLGVFGLEFLGIKILLLRSIIGFIYLTFLPGAIVIRILRLRNLNILEYFLYLIGLSLSTLMFLGLIMNSFCLMIGIDKPISILSLSIILNIFILSSCLFLYKYRRSADDANGITTLIKINSYELAMLLLPFLSIFGAYSNNYLHDNRILLILVFLLSLIPLYSIWNAERDLHYGYQIFIVTLSLLFQGSLISSYIFGSDLSLEYYVSNLVVINNAWYSTSYNQLNAMLSLAMLAPIYSIFLDIDLTWVFKVIYPLFFSLVPVGLFKIYERQSNDLIAFISCFFFVSLFTVYSEMLSLARQEIAELYLVLLLLLIMNDSINNIKRSLLMIIFGLSLVVSHYSLSYIYMVAFVMVYLMQKYIIKINRELIYKNTKFDWCGSLTKRRFEEDTLIISSSFVLLFAVSALGWYMYVSGSSIISSVAHIGLHIATSIYTEFLDTKSSDGLDLVFKEMDSFWKSILRYFHLISQGLIILGLLTTIFRYDKSKFKSTYIFFSFISLLVCLSALFVPYFGNALNTTRLYHISLFFLSPFFALGWIAIFRLLPMFFKKNWIKDNHSACSRILAVYLSVYLLFNIGFIGELSQDSPSSISLSQNSIIDHGSLKEKALYSSVIHTYKQDVYGAWWLSNFSSRNSSYYSDFISKYCLLSYGMIDRSQIQEISNTTKEMKPNSYVRLGYSNIIYGVSLYRTPSRQSVPFSTSDLEAMLSRKNNIYVNGANIIYYV